MALYGRDTENVERTGRMTLWTLMSDALRNLERIKRDPRYVIDGTSRWMTVATCATLIGILEPEQDLHGQLDYKALRTLARGDIRHVVREGPRNAPHFASGLEALK